jgi:hypothetical protein
MVDVKSFIVLGPVVNFTKLFWRNLHYCERIALSFYAGYGKLRRKKFYEIGDRTDFLGLANLRGLSPAEHQLLLPGNPRQGDSN